MERKRVRIYKAPDGQGEYRSKLKSFIKAQEGMSVDDSQMRRTQQDALKDNAINTYIKHINEQLKDGMSVETIYKDLIDKGLAEEEAAGVLKYFIENNLENSTDDTEESGEQEQPAMQEGGVPEEVLGEYDAVRGSESEDEEDGIDITKLLKEPAENYLSDLQSNSKLYFPSLSDYVYDYKPIQWIDTNQNSVYGGLEQSKKGGVAKKNFVKNVLKHFQEGGDEPANQGDKMDTITSDISNKKKAFIAKLKQVNEEEKLKNLYDQMMETNDPDLMQTAQTIAGGNDGAGVDNEESLAQQQYGGYSGEGQPELFMYGGIDFPYDLEQAQDGKEVRKTKVKYTPNPTLPSSKLRLFNPAWGERKIYTNRPYNALTRELYRDPVDDLTPVARTVHKRGIFGRPKKWTDYYSKDGKLMIPPGTTDMLPKKEEKKLIHGYPEEVWDDLSGKARRAIKRGERRLNRRKGYEDEKELTIQELIALQEEQRKKENDKAYKERKDAIEKDNKRLEEEKKLERVNDPDRKKADWETVNDRINNKLEQYTKEQLEKFDKESEKPKKPGLLEAIKAESDKISSQQLVDQMYNSAYPNSPLLLHNSNEEDFLENWYLPKIEQSEEFQPSSEMMEPGLNDYYKFGYGKSKATLAEEEAKREAQEAEEADEFEQNMIRGKRGFSYGGILHKAQIGVKTPTNGISSLSDPTATTAMLPGTGPLKPTAKLKEQDWHAPMVAPIDDSQDDKSPLPEWLQSDKWMNSLTQKDEEPQQDGELIAQDFESKRDFNGEAFNNKLNAGIDFFTGAAKALDKNKQMAEYYQNNIGVDAFMNPQIAKSKGKFVAYGQESGLIDPTKMGNERNSIFAGTDSAQSGGYMQDGGQSREEILKQFTGTPEFKKGLDLMMQRENTDNADPFFDAMRDANYNDEDMSMYRQAIGGMNEDWEKIVPQKSPYTKSGRHRELQDLMNKTYGSERYNTPYAPGGGGPRREDEQYFPTAERRPTPFEDGRIDPRTLEAIQPGPNEYEGMKLGGSAYDYDEYAEGGVFDMDEDELREFLANGGEVEYLES